MHKSKLSVLLVTYNHQKYIKAAIDSIIRQDLRPRPEIIVADDGSTDNTREHIRDEFAKRPEFRLRFLDYSRNRGVTRNYQRSFPQLDTEYVAILEGDDRWLDATKLARQVDTLDRNPHACAVSTNYLVENASDGVAYPRIQPERGRLSFIDSRMLIQDNLIGNFSNCMYRTNALLTLPPGLFSQKSYDWIINIILAQERPIAFLHDVTTAYVLHPSGTWSSLSAKEKIESQLRQINIYQTFTAPGLSDEWQRLRNRLSAELAAMSPTPVIKPASRIQKSGRRVPITNQPLTLDVEQLLPQTDGRTSSALSFFGGSSRGIQWAIEKITRTIQR